MPPDLKRVRFQVGQHEGAPGIPDQHDGQQPSLGRGLGVQEQVPGQHLRHCSDHVCSTFALAQLNHEPARRCAALPPGWDGAGRWAGAALRQTRPSFEQSLAPGPLPLKTGQWSAESGPLSVPDSSQLLTIRLGRAADLGHLSVSEGGVSMDFSSSMNVSKRRSIASSVSPSESPSVAWTATRPGQATGNLGHAVPSNGSSPRPMSEFVVPFRPR